jgi:CubicO group peptidase (beta-lactamase class C family)
MMFPAAFRLAVRQTLIALLAFPLAAQQLTPAERSRIDSAAGGILAGTGAPGASIAVVRGGELVYQQAYGEGRTGTPASSAMRYAIGSVSKQFTAAAILLLAEEGKLSLDDRVARWFPRLTRADEVTLRQLLSMTSGYQDYWPQDYVFTAMQSPTTADAILDRWAKQELDFAPGTSWQYSNTNYVIAAAVVERVAGMPFMDFLRTRIFDRLGMTSVADFNAGPLSPEDAGPYLRHAIGPLRPAPKEAKGWLFGAGQLAMTSRDLATWDLSLINQSVLKPGSYRDLMTTIVLTGGTATGYGLGVNVGMAGGRRRISHGGAVSGYTTTNLVYPDDKAAIVVFTNIYPGGGGAAGQIAARIASIILTPTDTTDTQALALARRVYADLAGGRIDRSLFTANASDYFTDQVLADYKSSLGPLGDVAEFTSNGSSLRGGVRIRGYQIRAGSTSLGLTMMVRPDGKIEQYVVER